MKNTKEFQIWVDKLREIYKDSFRIQALKGDPPYPMYHDDGSIVKKVNLSWVCLNSGETFEVKY